jgi:lysine 2,3-aminomutase
MAGAAKSRAGTQTLRTARDLVAAGLAQADQARSLGEIGKRYAIAVTPAMVDIIDSARADDPIARQFVPRKEELNQTPGERADPIGDGAHEVAPGLIHRYPDRVLLKLVSACAVYCRFCFRREQVGSGEGNLGSGDIDAALSYIRSHDQIWEVILSGGDPLMASPRRLAGLVSALGDITHVRVVRFHTRIPVVAPERISERLAQALSADGISTWLAIHANHPRELTPPAIAALRRLSGTGVNLISQSVLLRGVNDDAETLAALMRSFVEAGVKPYYLHHPDLAPGTSHFRLSLDEGRALVAELGRRVSGLCQPAYVLDIPGGYGKVPAGRAAVEIVDGRAVVTDRRGGSHAYPPSGPTSDPLAES